ncbi:hypothetical protein PHMEG_00025344 [Phytophthora megakarya]|uniref:Uncharacterized protein n=1 Tax=Phytophthora megakarya TaxID=4795 RepID=A0A225VDG9_9STRA|nr:hypothetical protein PHMEG_00025344 [Phytophthora megakarya]
MPVIDSAGRSSSSRRSSAEAAKPDSPKTVFDGSSVLSTDGGIPVDYEDGELEARMSPIPRLRLAVLVKTIRTLPRRSVREVQVIQLEALAITSERDATRTDDTVREPWMPSKSVIRDRYGALVPPNEIPLYVDNRIVDTLKLLRSTSTIRRTKARILHLALSRAPVLELEEDFREKQIARVAGTLSKLKPFSKTSVVQRVHEGSVNANIPCAVPEGVHCPHCLAGAPLISERDLTGYTTNRVPANIKELRAKLVCTRQHPSVVTEHNTPRNTAPRSVTPPVRGGLRTPSPFPERPSSGLFGETTYLEGDLIVSNEYENEPDLGSSSDWYGQQSDPPRGGSYRGQSFCWRCWTLIIWSTPALHARVEALATVQASESAELRQQLSLQKAYVDEADQTTSNIRVEVFEQVCLLQERVKRLEEKERTRRTSSSAGRHD